MIKTETLENLCQELHEYPPNWEEIIAKYKAHPKHDPEKEFPISQYTGFFSEIHMNLSLERIAETNPELGIDFEHPLSEGSESNGYGFHYDLAGRLYANSKKRKQNNNPSVTIQYDKVVLVDDLPVVFEIKTGRFIAASSTKKRYYGTGSFRRGDIKGNMRMEVVNIKLFPIGEFFKSDVGYVFIIPKDICDNRANAHGNSVYGKFLGNNGLVVPFYTDRHTFRGEVRQMVQDYGLKLRPG